MVDKSSKVFLDVCARFGVDPKVIAALVTVESTWNPWVCRLEPSYAYTVRVRDFAEMHRQTHTTELWHQRTSWGLLQVMGGTARDLGFSDCLTMLTSPAVGLEYGIRYFLTKQARYPELEDQIAAYNAGSARKDPLSKRYSNQAYVDKVLNALGR